MRRILVVLIGILFATNSLLAQAPTTASADPAPATQPTFDRLIAAIKANDRDAFLKDATDEMQRAITPELIEQIHTDLWPHMGKGYQATYLCELNQEGHKVWLWKVSFTDGSDDIVLRIVMQNGRFAGIWRQ